MEQPRNSLKKEFIIYYSSIVQEQIESGKKLEDINIDTRLTIVKPLHAQWLVNTYNFFTGPEGRKIFLKGWKKAVYQDLVHALYMLVHARYMLCAMHEYTNPCVYHAWIYTFTT